MRKINREIAQAWEQFVSTSVINLDIVPEIIAGSWQRCRDAKIDPYVGGTVELIKPEELESLRTQKNALIAIARPFMESLFDFVAGSGFVVILADENGTILETLGDLEINKKALAVNLIPGSNWREEKAGTNGIGTALVLSKPVQISGEEHYCKNIHTWTCSAAPITGDDGRVTGVLQMSGPSQASNKHTLGMVVAAVKAIEEQLSVKKKNQELTLVNNRMNSVFQTMSDGVMILNASGVVEQVNPSAERILNKSKNRIKGAPIEKVFENIPKIEEILKSGKPFSNVEVMAQSDKDHLHCLISGEALTDNQGRYLGGVIIINPINKIKKLVNRFAGAEARFQFSDIIGNSRQLQEAIRIAALAAENDSNILLEGESGTGKEVFAQAIHNASRRRDGPFVALNCAAIPRELMGSELFGYVEGAFTGAYRGGRPGKFELASGGTLFLDEIGDMNQGKQGALLRAIQEKQIVRIGDNKVIPVDVRIICATNKNLREAVEKKNFREDLYYRLNVITIKLPPLRDHREDIPQLFAYFLDEISRRLAIEIDDYDPGIVEAMTRYDWPGNARELQNVVERMVCVARDKRLSFKDLPGEILEVNTVDLEDKDLPTAGAVASVGLERQRRKQLRSAAEGQEIVELLGRYGGNITMVARHMGISRNTLYRKIREHNILL